MKNLKYFSILLFVLIILFFYFGKSNKDKNETGNIQTKIDKAIAEKNMTKFSNYKVDDSGKRVPEIKAVTFAEKPFENHDLKADVHLSIPSEDIEFTFSWFVNDKPVNGINSNTLPKEFFKNGDWVFCKVKIANLKTETPVVKSKYTRILGTTPILDLPPIPEITIPGEFRYKIEARLPGEDNPDPATDRDGNEDFLEDFSNNLGLKFTLISPTDKNIFLDEDSGEILWYITDDLISSLGNSVEITFRVSNPEGGSVTSSIKLSFKKSESDEEPK